MGLFKESEKYLVIGMGNPEKRYFNTYHNVGFMCLDRAAELLKAEFVKGECRAVTAHTNVDRAKVILAKPITYMNLTGESAVELINKYKIEQDKFIVIYDDTDLPIGKLRIRKTGTAGTHNGMRNVVKMVNSEDIFRMRVGIGRPPVEDMQLMDFVLSDVDEQAKKALDVGIEQAARAVVDFVGGMPIDEVMQKYNKHGD
ncbi:MAG: aminoacyl-tRNA hydrolase [Clostridia bacterium]|nr:aminoacyl-tRNA hydrolase [Clostridia bacterium]